jgi:hypothetical protein
VFTAISNLKKGKFAGGTNLLFNAKNGGVGLGKINAGASAAVKAKAKSVAAQVASGAIKPPTKCSPNPNC